MRSTAGWSPSAERGPRGAPCRSRAARRSRRGWRRPARAGRGRPTAGRGRRARRRRSLALGPGGDPTLDLGLEPRAQVERLGVHGQPAGVDPRGVEQLGDQPGHPVGVGLDRLEHQPLLVVGEPVPVAQQGRGEPLDAGQRRAQLVGDGGEQRGALGLGPAAPLGVAQAEHDGAHRLARPAPHVLRGDEQLAPGGQHEQPLAVPGAGDQALPRVGDLPPRQPLEVLQRQRLADVAADDVDGGEAGDPLGARVHEAHGRVGADRRRRGRRG